MTTPALARPSRRAFFRIVGWTSRAAVALLLGVPSIGYLLDPLRRRGDPGGWTAVGPIDAIPGGKPTFFRVTRTRRDGYLETRERRAVWIVREAESLRAYSASCTHLGCQVAWNGSTDRFECPCHGGRFSRTGEVLDGPPPRPLVRFQTRVRDGVLELGGPEA